MPSDPDDDDVDHLASVDPIAEHEHAEAERTVVIRWYQAIIALLLCALVVGAVGWRYAGHEETRATTNGAVAKAGVGLADQLDHLCDSRDARVVAYVRKYHLCAEAKAVKEMASKIDAGDAVPAVLTHTVTVTGPDTTVTAPAVPPAPAQTVTYTVPGAPGQVVTVTTTATPPPALTLPDVDATPWHPPMVVPTQPPASTVTALVTTPGPVVSVPGPVVTVPGVVTTATVTPPPVIVTATITAPAGPPVTEVRTEVVPGPTTTATVTQTETVTVTATVTETTTATVTATETTTETATPPAETITVTTTPTDAPTETLTVTATPTDQTTATETVTTPPETVTAAPETTTVTAPAPTVTVTVTCNPGGHCR